jgi:hypothetical protein
MYHSLGTAKSYVRAQGVQRVECRSLGLLSLLGYASYIKPRWYLHYYTMVKAKSMAIRRVVIPDTLHLDTNIFGVAQTMLY